MGVTSGLETLEESCETCLEPAPAQFLTLEAARELGLEPRDNGSSPRLCHLSWLSAFWSASLARASEISIWTQGQPGFGAPGVPGMDGVSSAVEVGHWHG